jgi:hypothetical protein
LLTYPVNQFCRFYQTYSSAFAYPLILSAFVPIPLFHKSDNESKDSGRKPGLTISSGLIMRKGFLGTLVLLLGSATAAHAQQWPTYGYQQWPYGYPQYYGYGYPQYSGYYQMPRQGYYPAAQQWSPQQVQVNSALVYPRAGYANPNYPQGSTPQSTTTSYVPAPKIVTLPQTVSQTVPEALPTGPETAPLPSSTVITDPVSVLPPVSTGCGPACEHNDLLVPPKEPCRPPCKHECFWITPSFIMAWTKPQAAVPLVSTGFAGVGTVPGDPIPGALGQPNTVVLYETSSLQYGLMPGVRLDGGVWLDQDNRFSLEGSGFYLPQAHQRFSAASDVNGNPLITRPFFNPITAQEEAFIVSSSGQGTAPQQIAGSINIGNTQTLWGAEINGRWHEPIGRYFQLQALAGVRYFGLRESLGIDETLTPLVGGNLSGLSFLANPVNPPQFLTTTDQFRTTNDFYGFQLGGALRWENPRFFFLAQAKAAVGVNQQSVAIAGNTLLFGPGALEGSAPGGILALPSNIGGHNRSMVSVLPEGGITAGVNITSWLSFQAGYTFLYLNNVVRPNSSIDRTVNPNFVPSDADFGALGGPARPAFQFHEEGFWVHMFNFGLSFHY